MGIGSNKRIGKFLPMVKKFTGSKVIKLPWISILSCCCISNEFNSLLFVKIKDRKVRKDGRQSMVSVWTVRVRSRPNWCSIIWDGYDSNINIFLRQAIQYQGFARCSTITGSCSSRNGCKSKTEDMRSTLWISLLRLDGGLACLRFVIINSLKKIFKLAMKRGLKADLLKEVLNFLPVQEKNFLSDIVTINWPIQAFPRCSGVSPPAGLAFGLLKSGWIDCWGQEVTVIVLETRRTWS